MHYSIISLVRLKNPIKKRFLDLRELYKCIRKCNCQDPEFISEPKPASEIYSKLISQLNRLESSTITSDPSNIDVASTNSIEIGFKLFPILEFISYNLLNKRNPRDYLKTLDYSGIEADLMISMFRNGLLHNINPHRFVYEDGEVDWGLMSSSGSGGFRPHYPGFEDKDNPGNNIPADKAFTYEKLSDGSFHASLSLDRLVAHIKYDLEQRKITERRSAIDYIVGLRFASKVPKPK